MKRCLLAFALLAAFSWDARSAPTYDDFVIKPEDTIKMGPVGLDHRFEVTLCATRARELLEFTGKHVGQTVVFCWVETNQATRGETIYCNGFIVKTPIRDGVLRLGWPHINLKTGRLFVGA
jgi:hypothetical protein